MNILLAIVALMLLAVVLWDAFETVVLPRRVTRRYRLVGLFYRTAWPLWSGVVRRLVAFKYRETALSYFGPLSMILLLAFWAGALVFAFGTLYWIDESALKTATSVPPSWGMCLYFSGTTFFTLGLGDIAPVTPYTRALVAVEAGLGFGFLAIVISYLPAIHQSFARREVNISLLDARAGSPPSASEILKRQTSDKTIVALTELLREWERWCAELLESHLSFPMLVYFRSQHDNQSWLGALTAILDVSAFVIASLEGECTRQARLTFAIARHTLVDLALVLHTPPRGMIAHRLGNAQLAQLRSIASDAHLTLRPNTEAEEALRTLQDLYEPYIVSLSARLHLPLPAWVRLTGAPDNWEVSAWSAKTRRNDHF